MLLSISIMCLYFPSCCKVYISLKENIAMLERDNSELGLNIYFQISNSANHCAFAATMYASKEGPEFSAVAYKIMDQAFILY